MKNRFEFVTEFAHILLHNGNKFGGLVNNCNEAAAENFGSKILQNVRKNREKIRKQFRKDILYLEEKNIFDRITQVSFHNIKFWPMKNLFEIEYTVSRHTKCNKCTLGRHSFLLFYKDSILNFKSFVEYKNIPNIRF